MMRLPIAIALALSLSLSLAGPASATERRAAFGAAGYEAGAVALGAGGGLSFNLLQLTLDGRVDMGAGTHLSLRYRTIAGLGHQGRARLGWGMPVGRTLRLGGSMRTTITSLGGGEGFFGVKFANISLGNDLEVGFDLAATWERLGSAHVSLLVGVTWTLGGVRFSSVEDSSFVIDPAIRSLDVGVQGEWELGPRLNLVLRLDMQFLLRAEIKPIGFLPTGTAGVAWKL